MLKLLLDEHISPDVAEALRRRTRTSVVALAEWGAGEFLGQDDEALLREAAAQGLTLVTYDRRTIPPLLKTWAEAGRRHAGVIFVDDRTIAPSDIGGLVRALEECLQTCARWDWADRICFLRR